MVLMVIGELSAADDVDSAFFSSVSSGSLLSISVVSASNVSLCVVVVWDSVSVFVASMSVLVTDSVSVVQVTMVHRCFYSTESNSFFLSFSTPDSHPS